ncbi:MAG: response regulator [Pseudomonadota bacterium]
MAKVLIVDDSETQRYTLSKLIEEQGHEVVTAEDGEAGISAAVSNHPDLILMDVVMPGLNGFQATRKISRNAETADIPIIFVTTKDQETDRIWGMRQGASAYLTKPVDKKELISAMNDALGAA